MNMTIRVLDVLNFSNSRNPLADSGIRLKRELLKAIFKQRKDITFHLLLPRELIPVFEPDLRNANVTLHPTCAVPRQRGGAFHFDVHEMTRLLDFRKMDVDVLFINQPELTAPFLDFFNKVHFYDVPAFGYVHWYDWKRNDDIKNRWNAPANLSILTGVLLSAVTGCNSAFGKACILRDARRYFHPDVVQEIDRRMEPLHPGIDSCAIARARVSKGSERKTILFPYRALKYTGFKGLVEQQLPRLWERRKDFRLLLTNPSRYDFVRNYPRRYPFVEVADLDREEYLEALWRSDIIIGSHNGWNQWSLAAVEALAAECVPLFNSSSFFPEMLQAVLPGERGKELSKRWFYYHGTFAAKLDALLDNLDEDRRCMRIVGEAIRAEYDWSRRATEWIRCIERADHASVEITERSSVMRRVEHFIQQGGTRTKEEILRFLAWHPKSRQISWTKYRKGLRRKFFDDPAQSAASFSVRSSRKGRGRRRA